MSLTRAQFLQYFPEFGSVAVPKLNLYVGVAVSRVNSTVWGDCAEYAQALLMAHMLASSGSGASDGGSSGAVTSESVGDLSRSYGSVDVKSDGDKMLAQTKYGREFLALRAECVVPASITGC